MMMMMILTLIWHFVPNMHLMLKPNLHQINFQIVLLKKCKEKVFKNMTVYSKLIPYVTAAFSGICRVICISNFQYG